MTYNAWLNGEDLKSIYTQRTFYRVRKEMEKYGIDISTKSPKEKSNVIPLIQYWKPSQSEYLIGLMKETLSLDEVFCLFLEKRGSVHS